MGKILLINPRSTKKAKKGVKKMAKKKGKKKGGKRGGNIKSRARGAMAGLNFKGAVKDMVPTQIGMFSAKWLAKKFGPDASETDPESWDWHSYLKGALGAAIAGFVLNMVKPGWGSKAMSGGFNLMVFKAIENEGIIKSDWATRQFGFGAPDGSIDDLEEIVLDGAYGPEMYDENANLLPADDSYRGVLQEPGRLGQEPLVEPGRLGRLSPAYANAFLRQA